MLTQEDLTKGGTRILCEKIKIQKELFGKSKISLGHFIKKHYFFFLKDFIRN
jgi:hypothetical protein